MPEIKAYDINSWPKDWREKGEMAKKIILANPGFSINSPEYHDYMDYCHKVILFEQETKHSTGNS
ncbi:hypothetical protein ES707_15972 [subsurface metagenome]